MKNFVRVFFFTYLISSEVSFNEERNVSFFPQKLVLFINIVRLTSILFSFDAKLLHFLFFIHTIRPITYTNTYISFYVIYRTTPTNSWMQLFAKICIAIESKSSRKNLLSAFSALLFVALIIKLVAWNFKRFNNLFKSCNNPHSFKNGM